ncbi:hypothetical protein GH714_006264 [Hevea brasiliensis]|uniref:Serine carboxypeptidase S28 family protein n=1 Tax=Hevea brasiliensis TaxID=3981 RepID=A0A6A6MAX2_HEVBR|nr:hypothetical protein GH714_006264 [Hevea brasiliensis]
MFMFLYFTSFATAFADNIIPRLHPLRGRIRRLPETSGTSMSEDFQTIYYDQTLDHFNYRPESYTTFKQRYVINFKYWGGANASAPIFAYLGAEAPIDEDLAGIGFLTENAAQFSALVVFIEHRFYGKSVPFGSFIKALKNANVRGYFNSAQALADYAEILIYLKKKLSAHYSPVIVIGASYGGTQYDAPPEYPVNMICDAIDEGLLEKIFSAKYLQLLLPLLVPIPVLAMLIHQYSIRNRFGMGMAGILNNSMFPPDPFILSSRIKQCKSEFGVVPRPHWITTYYGGHDIKLILQRFASNIIFSNGLRDPLSSGGVLQNISDTLLAVYTVNGSHALDLLRAKQVIHSG